MLHEYNQMILGLSGGSLSSGLLKLSSAKPQYFGNCPPSRKSRFHQRFPLLVHICFLAMGPDPSHYARRVLPR